MPPAIAGPIAAATRPATLAPAKRISRLVATGGIDPLDPEPDHYLTLLSVAKALAIKHHECQSMRMHTSAGAPRPERVERPWLRGASAAGAAAPPTFRKPSFQAGSRCCQVPPALIMFACTALRCISRASSPLSLPLPPASSLDTLPSRTHSALRSSTMARLREAGGPSPKLRRRDIVACIST